MQQEVCKIDAQIMQDFHIEPDNYNLVINIKNGEDVQLIINKDRVFETLKNHGKIVGSINKKLNDILAQMKIPTEQFAYLNDRESVGNVQIMLNKIIQNRLDALEAKERKKRE